MKRWMKKKKGGDSRTNKAMCVGIGSFSDPPEAQGLAHFLEHMLFMGSTEFPGENEKSRESLDVLENWVLELFGNVKQGPQVNLEFKAEGTLWKAGKLYRQEAVKDVHILHLTWTLPCLRQDYLKKSEDYLSDLLGHEGRGSLHSYFKVKGWATSLAADVGNDRMHHCSVAYVFCMDIHLTDSGLDKIFDIIGLVYQYIKLCIKCPHKNGYLRNCRILGTWGAASGLLCLRTCRKFTNLCSRTCYLWVLCIQNLGSGIDQLCS
ncbi:putative nardilysin [Rosa chinensis]|uniref:Putative nardilysin n=1 Tax=Rosa chinensis TaxID=74649 RepID=A0A2P6S9C2_ROSCH|nr:putative nardilysin [Rosa chinensis]